MAADLVLALGLAGIFVGLVIAVMTVGLVTHDRRQVSRSLAAVRAINASPASACQPSSTGPSGSGS